MAKRQHCMPDRHTAGRNAVRSIKVLTVGGGRGRSLRNGAGHALQAVLKVKTVEKRGGNSTEGHRCHQSVDPPELNWKYRRIREGINMIKVTEETLTLSVPATAKLLGISRGKCYQAIATGEIPNLRIGKRILVPRAALLAMLSAAGSRQMAKAA